MCVCVCGGGGGSCLILCAIGAAQFTDFVSYNRIKHCVFCTPLQPSILITWLPSRRTVACIKNSENKRNLWVWNTSSYRFYNVISIGHSWQKIQICYYGLELFVRYLMPRKNMNLVYIQSPPTSCFVEKCKTVIAILFCETRHVLRL